MCVQTKSEGSGREGGRGSQSESAREGERNRQVDSGSYSEKSLRVRIMVKQSTSMIMKPC